MAFVLFNYFKSVLESVLDNLHLWDNYTDKHTEFVRRSSNMMKRKWHCFVFKSNNYYAKQCYSQLKLTWKIHGCIPLKINPFNTGCPEKKQIFTKFTTEACLCQIIQEVSVLLLFFKSLYNRNKTIKSFYFNLVFFCITNKKKYIQKFVFFLSEIGLITFLQWNEAGCVIQSILKHLQCFWSWKF